jgi:hypothetical protein
VTLMLLHELNDREPHCHLSYRPSKHVPEKVI